jgi:hypothetical protein
MKLLAGAKPDIVLSIKGDQAGTLIPKITVAVSRYPWAEEYTLVPSLNSNIFPAWIGLREPELGLKMLATSDWQWLCRIIRSEIHTGVVSCHLEEKFPLSSFYIHVCCGTYPHAGATILNEVRRRE